MSATFKFIEFNPCRAQRGAEATRVEVTEHGESTQLWMSKSDLKNNLKEFGEDPELRKALAAYFGTA